MTDDSMTAKRPWTCFTIGFHMSRERWDIETREANYYDMPGCSGPTEYGTLLSPAEYEKWKTWRVASLNKRKRGRPRLLDSWNKEARRLDYVIEFEREWDTGKFKTKNQLYLKMAKKYKHRLKVKIDTDRHWIDAMRQCLKDPMRKMVKLSGK
jgi:hypothetical protein